MAIFNMNIPKNAIDVNINMVLVDIDENNYELYDNEINFDNEQIENLDQFIRVIYTTIADDGIEITVVRLSNIF